MTDFDDNKILGDTESMPDLAERSDSNPSSPGGGQPLDIVVFEYYNAHVLLHGAVVFNADEVGINPVLGNEANAMDMYQPNDVQPPLPAPPILERLLKCCP